MENTAELVLYLAALTLPRGHGPVPPGWGVAVGTNHGHFCARFALQQTGQAEKFRAMVLAHISSQAARGSLPGSAPWAAGVWGSRWSPGTRGSAAAPDGDRASGQGCRAPREGPGGRTALWETGISLCKRAGMAGTLGSHPGSTPVPPARMRSSSSEPPFCSPG